MGMFSDVYVVEVASDRAVVRTICETPAELMKAVHKTLYASPVPVPVFILRGFQRVCVPSMAFFLQEFPECRPFLSRAF